MQRLINLFIDSRAVVLKTIPFSDTSLICRIFTKEKGKISIMAKGAKRKKNLLSSVLECGNIIRLQYMFKENRDIQLLKEASLDYNIILIRKDLEKLLTLFSIIEILDKTTHPLNEAPILFRLISSTIKTLAVKKLNSKILYNFYLLHLAIQNGFKPNITNCSKCNTLFRHKIVLINGQLYCQSCDNFNSKLIHENSLSFIKKLMYTNINKINDLNVNDINLNSISFFLEDYIRYHIEGMNYVKSTSLLHKLSK